MRTIKVSEENWEKLMTLKLELKLKSIDEIISLYQDKKINKILRGIIFKNV